MKSDIKCSIKGQYKVDIFKDGEFVSTTDWFDNDITNTGVLYPFNYSFARCFMFLSLGSGTFNSTSSGLIGYTGFGGGNGTTAIGAFQTSDGNFQTGAYMGWPFYASGLAGSSACGTQFTPSGMNLSRSWNLPSGNTSVGGNGLHIQSFMVSPSSGSDPSGCCAFSCVNQDVFIPSGYNATIYYMLSLNFNDYAQPYVYFPTGVGSNGYFNTGNAIIGGVDTTLVSGWSHLSGIYRQLFPGLQCIDNYGACVATSLGAQMEPSLINAGNTYLYLSPDIGNFATSKFDGTGVFGGIESGAYNSCGLSANYSEYCAYIGDNAVTKVNQNASIASLDKNIFYYSGDGVNNSSFMFSLTNTIPMTNYENPAIHLSSIPTISGYTGIIPKGTSNGQFQYNSVNFVNATGKPLAYASPGGSLFNSSIPNYGQPAVFSTSLRRIPPTPNVGGRIQKSTKSARISPIQSLGWNARYGSMVLANFSSSLPNIGSIDITQMNPYIEYLFFDNSGRGANMPHYRIIPEIYLTNRGTGVYQAVFSITGQGIDGSPNSPIQRIWNATGFCGGYTGTNVSGLRSDYPWTGYFSGTNLSSGIIFSGANIPSNLTGSFSSGTYGYGAVYGILAHNSGFYSLPYDCCLLDNPIWSGFTSDQGGSIPCPTGETGKLIWPYQSASPIGLAISGLQFWSPNFSGTFVYSDTNNYISKSGFQLVGDITGVGGASVLASIGTGITINNIVCAVSSSTHKITGSSVTGISSINAATNGTYGFVPTNFCAPSGRIHHLEFFTGSGFTGGYRLLPNYASGNNSFSGDLASNTYSPVIGGAFPGLSSQNGMQIYFDFIWSA